MKNIWRNGMMGLVVGDVSALDNLVVCSWLALCACGPSCFGRRFDALCDRAAVG